MIKILAVCPTPTDATSFYRCVWPLAKLQSDGEISFDTVTERDWVKMAVADIVFLQRPYLPKHKTICEEAKLWGKKIWLDYDDWLYDVPATNPAHGVYSNNTVQEVMDYCIEQADVITVSTSPLQKLLAAKFPHKSFVVVPNGIDLELFSYRDVNWESRKAFVAWRGGSTHEKDVATVAEQLISLSKRNTQWRFLFFGHDFTFLNMLMPKNSYIFVGKFDTANYMKKLHSIQAPIHIVPLEFNDFNDAKSNIAWLEATWAGSAVIAPDMVEWKRPGVLTYKTPQEFEAAVQHLITNPGKIEELNKASWKDILTNYDLKVTNKKRLEVIKELKV